MSRLDDTSHCPVGNTCRSCGGTQDLEVATLETPVGVYCATLCIGCVDASELGPAPASWEEANELVLAHCVHLGITADRMAELLERWHSGDDD